MADILHTLHWGARYLVLLAAAAAALTAAAAWRRTGGPERSERLSMAAFAGLLDLQVLLGIVLLVVWPFYPALIGHIVMMILAAVAAHVGSVFARRREPARSGSPVRLVSVLLAVVLIVGGIMAIQRPVI
jgi:hypothetical protein